MGPAADGCPQDRTPAWECVATTNVASSTPADLEEELITYVSEQKLSTSCEEKNSLGTNIAVGVMGLLLGALLGVAGNSFLGHKGKELKNLGLRLAQAST